jgi:hypothetical protein
MSTGLPHAARCRRRNRQSAWRRSSVLPPRPEPRPPAGPRIVRHASWQAAEMPGARSTLTTDREDEVRPSARGPRAGGPRLAGHGGPRRPPRTRPRRRRDPGASAHRWSFELPAWALSASDRAVPGHDGRPGGVARALLARVDAHAGGGGVRAPRCSHRRPRHSPVASAFAVRVQTHGPSVHVRESALPYSLQPTPRGGAPRSRRRATGSSPSSPR